MPGYGPIDGYPQEVQEDCPVEANIIGRSGLSSVADCTTDQNNIRQEGRLEEDREEGEERERKTINDLARYVFDSLIHADNRAHRERPAAVIARESREAAYILLGLSIQS